MGSREGGRVLDGPRERKKPRVPQPLFPIRRCYPPESLFSLYTFLITERPDGKNEMLSKVNEGNCS